MADWQQQTASPWGQTVVETEPEYLGVLPAQVYEVAPPPQLREPGVILPRGVTSPPTEAPQYPSSCSGMGWNLQCIWETRPVLLVAVGAAVVVGAVWLLMRLRGK